MDARLLRVSAIAAAVLSLGASYRTQNFVVTARHPQLAQEVANLAEEYRRDLAIQWLGHELPPWSQPCPIEVNEGPRLGAGGATSFMFEGNRPFGWRMSVQGTRERILDSVLPHEVTHTIFATHFGRPLPRWADEGACTTVEHASERRKQDHLLRRFLTTERGIPFNKMFAMKEYPHDILPLYSQGYSVVRFLLEQGGQRKLVDYIGYGMQTRNWNEATRQFYSYRDLSDLQLQWVDWVQAGSPPLAASQPTQLADLDASRNQNGVQLASTSTPARNRAASEGLVPVPEAPWQPGGTVAAIGSQKDPVLRGGASGPPADSWYARHRRRAQAGQDQRLGPPGVRIATPAVLPSADDLAARALARPQTAEQVGEQVLQWDDQQPPPLGFVPQAVQVPPGIPYGSVPLNAGGVGRR